MIRSQANSGILSATKDTASVIPHEKTFSLRRVIVFALFNILLAYLSRQSQLFSTVYGWSTLSIGLFYLMVDKKPTRLIYLCGYIIGAELIWRLTKANVFYEYGKYATAFLLLLAILKYGLLKKSTKLPFVYFVLLLPSITVLPFFDRNAISFFLSGPFQLAVSTMFFSTISLSETQIKNLLINVIAPTIGIAFLAGYNTLTATELVFTTESNFITSGGFGPVQISLQLAFGALLAFYYATTEKKDRLLIFFLVAVAIWLMSQSIFTFSRSGLYNVGATLLALSLFSLRQGTQRIRLFLLLGMVVLFLAQIAFPYMDQFTGGMLSLRYQDTTTSGRDTLVKADLQAFRENPFAGVGPGQSIKYHILFGKISSSHTEYTRLLAEHGSFGLLSLLILLAIAARRLFRRALSGGKSFQVLVTVWALSYMLSVTMRTALPGFAFGLGAAWVLFDERDRSDESDHSTSGQFLGSHREPWAR